MAWGLSWQSRAGAPFPNSACEPNRTTQVYSAPPPISYYFVALLPLCSPSFLPPNPLFPIPGNMLVRTPRAADRSSAADLRGRLVPGGMTDCGPAAQVGWSGTGLGCLQQLRPSTSSEHTSLVPRVFARSTS